MPSLQLDQFSPWNAESGCLNVIIETPKCSRNKFAYDPEQGLFELSKVLPRGTVFPFDFGFVPSTLGEDGDPLDILVLMDEPAFPGCKIACRLIGVIEAEQTDKHGKVLRNDRLIAVAEESQEHKDVASVKDLAKSLVEEIEHFFHSYHELDGGRFQSLGCRGPGRAEKLIQAGGKRFRKKRKRLREPVANGKAAKP